MVPVWPQGVPRIPEEDWATGPVESLALNYDTVEGHGWYRNLNKTVRDIRHHVKAGDFIVDYSGGTGILASRLLEEIDERNFGILIVDSSPKFLRLALEKLGHFERVGFRLIRYLKDQKRLQTLQEVLGVTLLERGLDAIVSTNAIHLYYGLEGTLSSWHDVLRPGGRAFIQSGNMGLPYMPQGSWIIDETVDAIDAAARRKVLEDSRWSAYRAVLNAGERMEKYDTLRKKYFLPVRPVDHYLGTLEAAGFRIQEVTHLPIEAHVDQWYEFLATYHEGVLGWVGGVRRIEGEEPSDAAVQDRLTLIRESMDEIFEEKPSFQALWSYIHALRPEVG